MLVCDNLFIDSALKAFAVTQGQTQAGVCPGVYITLAQSSPMLKVSPSAKSLSNCEPSFWKLGPRLKTLAKTSCLGPQSFQAYCKDTRVGYSPQGRSALQA